MNIFVLDLDPTIAAKHQVDKHVVKMPLETAQLLCSVFPEGAAPYKRTHYNHPCSKWVRESYGNYLWLIKHGYALCDEYSLRYGKNHKCRDVIKWCEDNIRQNMFKSLDATQHPKCMPDEFKDEDVVLSYRKYYREGKKNIASWKANKPDWW